MNARDLSSRRVAVAGAGPVGALLAILLKKRGYAVELFERRGDPRAKGYIGGRSINLALSDRGLLALSGAGIGAEIEEVAVPMPGRMMHAIDGTTNFAAYGLNGEAIRSVSRGGLNIRLLDLVDQHGIPVHFEHVCSGVDVTSGRATFATPAGNRDVDADVTLGCDGAFSAVRASLRRTDRFDDSQSYLEHGYKELEIGAGADGAFLLEKNALHIWPRSAYMLIALPNLDGSFTCTLFFPFESSTSDPDASFAALDTPARARAFFARVFPDALALMPDFEGQWSRNPVSSLCTVRCYPWSRNGRVGLVGDSAHAIVPFFGQGMNCGFEDCRVLMEILDACDDDWTRALPHYEKTRKPDGDAIATLALENFIEMRDKVADPEFQLRKKLEAAVARTCADRFTPSYTMVTFRPRLRYSEALARSRAQDRVLDALLAIPAVRANPNDAAHAPLIRRCVDEHLT